MNPMTQHRPLHSVARTIIIMVCVAALLNIAGCDNREANLNCSVYSQVAYSYEYDQVSSVTGLTLKATGDEVTFISFEDMDAEYIDLEACVANTNTPGPTIIYTSFNEYGFRLELALYYYALQTVFIDTDLKIGCLHETA